MKTIILAALMLTGCASVSEYNQGCRDGVKTFIEEKLKAGTEEGWINKGCDAIEARHKAEKETREGKR